MKVSVILFISGLALTSYLFTFNDALAAGFIKFDGIEGESLDRDHRGWSDLLSFSQVISDGDSRDNETSEIKVEKEIDKASPKIEESIVKGKVFPKVEIQFTVDGSYFFYKLTNVLVTSYSFSGNSNSRPVEEIHLNYEKISQDDEPIKEPEKTTTKPTQPATPTQDIPATVVVETRVPTWVQTTASFWVQGDVSDREFTDGIGYLVREKIIQIDQPVITKMPGEPIEPEVPSWIKQNVDWWIKDQVPEDQFLNSIKWLIQNNIITGVAN